MEEKKNINWLFTWETSDENMLSNEYFFVILSFIVNCFLVESIEKFSLVLNIRSITLALKIHKK